MNPRVKLAGAIVLLGMAIVLALVRCAKQRGSPGPSAEARRILEALDERVVAEALPLAGAGGRVVLLGFRTPAIGDPGPVELIERLRNRLSEAGLDVAPAALVDVPVDRLETTGQALTDDDWIRVLNRHEGADVLISLAGAPRLRTEREAAWPTPRPKLLVVSETPNETAEAVRSPWVDTLIYRVLDEPEGTSPYAVQRRSDS